MGGAKEMLKLLNNKQFQDKNQWHGLGTNIIKRVAKLYHWKLRYLDNEPQGLTCEILIREK